MKNAILLCFLCLSILNAQAQRLEFARQGCSLVLPKKWGQTPVTEANLPATVVEAKPEGVKGTFMMLIIQPTKEPAPKKERAKVWGAEMAAALGLKDNTCKLLKINSIDWYLFETRFPDGGRVILYSTLQHAQTYGLTFVSLDGYKELERDAKNTVESFRFSKPESFAEIHRAFQQMETDELSGLKVPKGYHFAQELPDNELPGYVKTNYESQLAEKSTNAILVNDDYFLQPFAINVVLEQAAMDTLSTGLVCRVTARRFEQNKVPYQEVYIGPWPKAPQQVYLFQFKLLKEDGATMHFIYYVNRGVRLDILKIQLPDGLEKEFLPDFEKWVLGNLE